MANVASNVAHYINMKEAGHWSYGLAYIITQVFNTCEPDNPYKNSNWSTRLQ